jgi:uncharacterized protein (TIGR03067 family)
LLEEKQMKHWNTLGVALLVVFLCSGMSWAADDGAKDTDKELQKFQGTWVMKSGEMGDKDLSDDHVKQGKIIYDGKTMKLQVPHHHSELIIAEIVKLDAKKDKKEMHFIRKNGPGAGKTLIGIYEFDGDDEYKFAFDPAGEKVLTKFDTEKGTGHLMHKWKKAKE